MRNVGAANSAATVHEVHVFEIQAFGLRIPVIAILSCEGCTKMSRNR